MPGLRQCRVWELSLRCVSDDSDWPLKPSDTGEPGRLSGGSVTLEHRETPPQCPLVAVSRPSFHSYSHDLNDRFWEKQTFTIVFLMSLLLMRNSDLERLLCPRKQPFGYYRSEGPLVTQSGHR